MKNLMYPRVENILTNWVIDNLAIDAITIPLLLPYCRYSLPPLQSHRGSYLVDTAKYDD